MGIGIWKERCITHYGEDALNFFKQYFEDTKRSCLLIGGAGFDPRSPYTVKYLNGILNNRLTAHFIKEIRRDPRKNELKQADANLLDIKSNCQRIYVEEIEIFADDNAVVGGRNTIKYLCDISLAEYTDIIIDVSALSIGVGYPTVAYIYETIKGLGKTINLHLVVLSNPELDALITSIPNDRASNIHGFGRSELYGDDESGRLWFPMLSENKKQVLKMIHSEVRPHDTCPIIPFPSEGIKKGDKIAWEIFSSIQTDWGDILENEWQLEPRDIIYADERKPLDIYRTILRINEERAPVFEMFGGSNIILSPLGNKIPAIGALMAAIECKLSVVYVEALGYNFDLEKVFKINSDNSRMTHVWLHGEAYLK